MIEFTPTATHLDASITRLTFARAAAPFVPLSRGEVLKLWSVDDGFCAAFTAALTASTFDAFFWETPSFATPSLAQPFECVLVRAASLADVAADPKPFEQPLRAGRVAADVISFASLGGDADLIVPRDRGGSYAHLAAFLRTAPPAQVREVWRLTAQTALSRVAKGRRVWISTSGLGVYWTHVRIDTRPKYYSFRPYQTS